MAYIRPLVMVYQEYANMSVSTQSATLVPCIVGPCYHIIDAENDELLASLGAYTGDLTAAIPSNYVGALIQEDSISIRLKSPVATLYTKVTGTKDSTVGSTITVAAADAPSVVVGDSVFVYLNEVDTSPAAIEYKVKSLKASGDNVVISLNKKVESTVAAIDVARKIEDVYVAPTSVTLSDGGLNGTVTLTGATAYINTNITAAPIRLADAYIEYKSLRQDLSEVGTVYSADEARGILGKLESGNPLGMGVMLCLANTDVGVKFIGVDSDDVAGYTAAKDHLETEENVYAIAVLSQEPEILSIFKAHAEMMSEPERGKWRVAIGSTKLVTADTLPATNESTGKSDCTLGNDASANLKLVTDSNAQFLTRGVEAGDTIIITKEATSYTFTVSAVITEDMLTVSEVLSDETTLLLGDACTYVLTKQLSLEKQAEYVAEASKSFGTSRFVHVWPDVIKVDGETLPGSYLGCAVAGMTGGLAPHQGFTRISIAGVGGLKHSNDYFNQAQLDTIADGGTFIFQQLTPNSAPYVRHQLTTDMSTTEMREFSFVKNFDYVSIILRDTMDAFIGKWNITPQTLGVLKTALRAVMESLKLYTLPRIGSPVLGYEITSVEQHDTIRDRVEMYCEVDFPYPLNTIGLHVVSR